MSKTKCSRLRTVIVRRRAGRGFTVLELLAVVVVLGLLTSLLVPTLAGTRTGSSSVRCRNNLRQLTGAWSMYAQDNRGRLVNNTDGVSAGLVSSSAAWIAGWLDFTASQANTDTQMLVDHAEFPYGAYLGPYLRDPRLFKCPADPSEIVVAGRRMPRVRSVSMNNYLGGNSRTWTSVSRYPVCARTAQIGFPAGMFVILDEHADSINDGWFASDPDTPWQIIDYPASYHDGDGCLSFADGHVEFHRWRDARTTPPFASGKLMALNQNFPNNVDIPWLQRRAAGVQSLP